MYPGRALPLNRGVGLAQAPRMYPRHALTVSHQRGLRFTHTTRVHPTGRPIGFQCCPRFAYRTGMDTGPALALDRRFGLAKTARVYFGDPFAVGCFIAELGFAYTARMYP